MKGVPGVTGTLGKPTAILTQPKRGRKPHHHVEAAVDWCSVSLTSCVSKLFERINLSRLLFFLVSNSILTASQANFFPEPSTLEQILFLSQSILDGFNKPKQSSRKILATILLQSF